MISKTDLHLAAGGNLNVNSYNTHFLKVKEDEFDEENCLDNPHLSGINGKVKEKYAKDNVEESSLENCLLDTIKQNALVKLDGTLSRTNNGNRGNPGSGPHFR
jgi:hypothetical protein